MKKDDTPDAPLPRKKMPAEVFVKMWLNRLSDVEERVWNEWITFDNVQGDRRANLSNVEVDDDILIENITGPILHLILSNCHLLNCELRNVTIRSVTIQEKSTIRDFRIENSTTEDFKILDSTTGKFTVKKSKTDYFVIDNTTIGDFLLQDSDATVLQISRNSTLSEVFIHHSSLTGIEIISGSFVEHLQCRFNLKEPVRLILEKSFVGHIDFNNSVFAEFTTLNISDCWINRLTLNNHCNYGTTFFSGLKPLKEWENFKRDEKNRLILENEKYQFEQVSPPSTIRLTDSDLGKVQFINCDLTEFEQFEFSNTKMLDVFVAGSQMPKSKSFRLPDEEELQKAVNKRDLKRRRFEQKRLAYGQFKKIYEARGDMPGSLRYLAFEMDAYLGQLIREKPWEKTGEIIMLVLNKISTNYGNNWGQGALVTVAVIFLCFANYLRLIGYEWGEWNEANIQLFKELFSYAPQYLNPFRDADSVIPGIKDENLRPSARVWDYLSRIFIAYFVYQTIQAFRKLGKSSG